MKVKETILDFCTGDWGEDRFFAGSELFCVIDGATSIHRQAFEGYHSSAEWMADRLRDHVARCAGDGRPHPAVCRAFVDATAGIRNAFGETYDLPCLTTAAVRVAGDRLNCWVLGDCSVYLLLEDGDVKRVTDRRIGAFYSKTLRAKEEALRRGEDAEAAMRRQRIRNKEFLNHPEGFWTVAYTGDFENYFVECSLERSRVRGALLCTDGFDRLFDFGIAQPKALLTGELTLHRALEMLRAWEVSMENGEKLNVKRHDDVAAILLEPR